MSDEVLCKALRQGSWSKYDYRYEAADRIEALLNLNEAKLAKAVEALRTTTQILSQCLFETILVKGQYLDRKEVVASARATLAEIEGSTSEGEKR